MIVMNFPAFIPSDVSVYLRLAGKQAVMLNSSEYQTSMSGDILQNNATFHLSPQAPANGDNGFATFFLTVKMNQRIIEVKFDFLYRLNIIGPPRPMRFLPNSAFTGQRLIVYLDVYNIVPITTASNSTIEISRSFQQPFTTEIVLSSTSLTLMQINLGEIPTAGMISIKICSLDTEGTFSCSIGVNISVEDPPLATVLNNSLFPKVVSAANGTISKLQFLVQYLPTTSKLSNFSAKMLTNQQNWIALEILTVTSISTQPCSMRYCSLHRFSLLLPASGNPDGETTSGSYPIHVFMSNSILGQMTFTYAAESAPRIRHVSTTSLVLPTSGQDVIQVYLENFPSSGCSTQTCFNSLDIAVKFGAIVGKLDRRSASGQTLVLNILVPAYNKAEMVSVLVTALSSNLNSSISFDFEFVAPPAMINPADGVLQGGTMVTITAIGWGDISNSVSDISQLYASFGGINAEILMILDAISNASYSAVSIVATTPAKQDNTAGAVSARIGMASPNSVVTHFRWMYYQVPQILNFVPANATVDGITGSEGQSTINISITGFPRVRTLSDLHVFFLILGTSKEIDTSVQSFRNFRDFLFITIDVPILTTTANLTASIVVEYPRAGFDTRTAESDSFEFYIPAMTVQHVRWCSECNRGAACIVNGMCGQRKIPLVDQAGLLEQGYLIVVFRNVYIPEPRATAPFFVLEFGDPLQNVTGSPLILDSEVSGHYKTVRAEFPVSELTSTGCRLRAIINASQTLALDGFKCVNRSVSVSCKDITTESDIPCAGPSEQQQRGFDFIARISGLQKPTNLNNAWQVDFGDVPALGVSMLSTETLFTDLLIRSPEFKTFSGSSWTVEMTIAAEVDAIFVTRQWTFWKAPSVRSVSFDNFGTKIEVLFDQKTDRGGGSLGGTCMQLLEVRDIISPFGASASCVWSDDDHMSISLGTGASITVDQQLSILGGYIKSKNGLSLSMPESVNKVGLSTYAQIPVIQLYGPSTIDPCSDLTIYAAGVSPRQLIFEWSCQNDEIFDHYLGNLPSFASVVQLAQGTPEMETQDKTYVVSVTATNFMGMRSDPVSIQILKKGSAVPQFVFTPPSHTIFRNQPLFISGEAQYSDCPVPRDKMVYTWQQISGPENAALSQRISRASSPQLYVPANSLEAGTQYIFALKLQIGGDVSRTSVSTVVVDVGLLPVLARIAGGSSFLFSSLLDWSLDASLSSDLDLADRAKDKQNLTFEWSCLFTDQYTSSPCTDENGTLLPKQTGALLRIGSNMLAPSEELPYMFLLSVQDSKRRKTRDMLAVAVSISSVHVVPVKVQLESGGRLRGSSMIINPDDRAVFLAVCGSGSASQVYWSIDPSSNQSLELLSGWIDNILVVDGSSSVFQAGQRYKISANCTDTNSEGLVISGMGSLTVNTNEPPSGGICTVCLLGEPGCVKVGNPIVDRFRVSCSNWADQDNPLKYRFGFLLDDTAATAWTALRSSFFVDVVLPFGEISVFAEIQDSFGSSSGIINVTQAGKLSIRNPSRRSLSQGINWGKASDQLVELSSKQSSKDMNSMISSMALQVGVELEWKVLDAWKSKDLILFLLDKAAEALSFALRTSENVCESYGVVRKLVSNPGTLVLPSLINATAIINVGVDDRSIIKTIDEECIGSAFSVFNDVRSALFQLSQTTDSQTTGIEFLELESKTISTLVDLFSTSLTTADKAFNLISSVSSHSIFRKKISPGQEEINFPPGFLLPDVQNSSAAFLISEQLLSTLNETAAGLNIHTSFSAHAPASQGLLIRSPVMGLTITLPDSELPIEMSRLTVGAINVSLPLMPMSDDVWTQFRHQAECLYWDHDKKGYSANGVQVMSVQRTHVVCKSSHLTDFVINQNLSILVPMPSSSSRESGGDSVTTPVATTVAVLDEFSFDRMLLVIGTKSAAMAMARMPWQAMNITLNQSSLALSLALKLTGGFGVPCTLAVPFMILPGLILSTVVGAVYPSDFALAVETSRPAVLDMQSNQVVSAITKFASVQGTRSNQVPVEITGLVPSSSRRASSCSSGTEWRFQRLGVYINTDCSCPANALCLGETVCKSSLNRGDRWAVVAVSQSSCQITGADSSNNSPLALGVGLGLGLGLPVIACCIYAALVYKAGNGKRADTGHVSSVPSQRIAAPEVVEHLVYIQEEPGPQNPVIPVTVSAVHQVPPRAPWKADNVRAWC